MYIDVFIASASAAVLIYSGILLAPSAHLRPDEIVGQITKNSGSFVSGGINEPAQFPAYEIQAAVDTVIESRMGLFLLISGTLGTTLATLVGSLSPQRQPSFALGAAVAAFGFVVGGAGALPLRSVWRRAQERWGVMKCFFVWLERNVGDPHAKHETPALKIGVVARYSGFQPLERIIQKSGGDNEVLCRQVFLLARRHGHRWQHPLFRDMADALAGRARWRLSR